MCQTKEKEVAVSKTTTSDEEPTSSAIHQRTDGSARIASAEETFSLVFLTPSLYCLAAVLPGDGCGWGEGTTDIEQAVSEQVLPALLEVAVCTIFQPTTSRLACIVAAQYMSRISPQVSQDPTFSLNPWPNHSPDGRCVHWQSTKYGSH